jgi:undecaprenyl-phosphate 4-deoxy-4-formamido-L-arabinose transferase
MKKPLLSVIVPVFNSIDTLEPLFLGIRDTLDRLGYPFEVIFVEDGSRKKSWERLVELKTEWPDLISIIKLSRNFGQNSATVCGINHSQGEWVITIDDDLQTPPEEIEKLIAAFESGDADVVYGIYSKQKSSIIRRLGSKGIKTLFRYLVKGAEIGSSFRLMGGNVIGELKKHDDPLVFIDQVVAWYTRDVAFVEVTHRKRENGKSGYSLFRLLNLALKLIIYYTDLPLRLMVYMGIISSVISFGFGVYFIGMKWMYDAPLGFTAIIVSVFFAASLILFSLGIVGLYITRIYLVQVKKPLYSIKIKR